MRRVGWKGSRWLVGVACAAVLATASAAYAAPAAGGGSGGRSATGSRRAGDARPEASYAPGGTLEVSMSTPPESLDPQLAYTIPAAEADWVVYTAPVTYAHKDGIAGDQLIPGLATALPTVSDGRKTYTFTLRKGLEYSNGVPVRASDFAYTVERAIKLGYGADSFFTDNIVGAAAYQAGKAKTISGITTDDSTGQVVVHLVAPFGAFDNVLTFVGMVPTGTPMTAQSTTPPPGVGPYKITSVKPNVSFTLEKNPLFAKFHIPGIPTGYVNTIQVTIQSNVDTEAQDVLDNTSDVFDRGDVLPPSYLAEVESKAKSRYKAETLAETYYYWLNSRTKPFDNPLAREAVNLAVSREALERLDSGQLTPACYYLPPDIIGHATGSCPFGAPSGGGSYSASGLGSPADVAKAKALVEKAGLAGTPVAVFTENVQPFESFGTYLVAQLGAIGFKATLKSISGSIYFSTIGSEKVDPQAGWAYWSQDYPNPGDFYLILDARTIQPVNNQNFGYVDDPHIQSTIERLDQVPSTDLSSVASQWQALERYVASKDYLVPFGYAQAPLFVSDRVDLAKVVFQPIVGDDWSTFELARQ